MKLIKFRRIKIKNKNNLSIKMMDLGNIAFETLLLSQLISDENFNIKVGLLGIITLISFYLSAIIITK